MPRPRSCDWLDDEVASWRRSGLTIIVSLLEDAEIAELGLEQEAAVCERAGILFLRLPIPDRGLPISGSAVSNLVGVLVGELRKGQGVGIHCRMGIGRSPLILASILVHTGSRPEDAWSAISAARGCLVPDTQEQRDWLHRQAPRPPSA